MWTKFDTPSEGQNSNDRLDGSTLSIGTTRITDRKQIVYK